MHNKKIIINFALVKQIQMVMIRKIIDYFKKSSAARNEKYIKEVVRRAIYIANDHNAEDAPVYIFIHDVPLFRLSDKSIDTCVGVEDANKLVQTIREQYERVLKGQSVKQ